jgi:thiamine pyrophosphokinase
MEAIVHSLEPITLIGGGPVDSADLAEALTITHLCVGADSGAQMAIENGVMPDAVIGDFDSIAPDVLTKIPRDRLHKITEQNSTDFDKALRHISAPVVIAVGFAGGRIDHQLAAFHTLLRHADRPCIIVGAQEIVFHCPTYIAVPLEKGETVSLFPMVPVTGRSTGLQWPIDGLKFAPDTFVGTSNHSLGPIELWMDGPGMLCILPRRYLAAVTRALADPPR